MRVMVADSVLRAMEKAERHDVYRRPAHPDLSCGPRDVAVEHHRESDTSGSAADHHLHLPSPAPDPYYHWAAGLPLLLDGVGKVRSSVAVHGAG